MPHPEPRDLARDERQLAAFLSRGRRCSVVPSPRSAAASASPASFGISRFSGHSARSTSVTAIPSPAKSLANSQPISPAPTIKTRLLSPNR
jgi:hypothetical protein